MLTAGGGPAGTATGPMVPSYRKCGMICLVNTFM